MKRKLARLMTGGLLALALCGGAAAGPYEDAESAYRHHDYAAALKLLLPLAEQGNPQAQNDLGMIYENGQGVAKDERQALAWYRKAADQGFDKAEFNLGAMYDLGGGAPQD